MTKIKNPVLSLRATGSLAGTLSFDNRSGQPRVRSKPTPLDRKTLLQLYQRWLFQDYTAYWHTLTTSEKESYRHSAARRRLIPYARFIQVMLATMPDICALWPFDIALGDDAVDVSSNQNTGTIIGASYTPGRIDTGLHFDGLDDYVLVLDHPSLNPTATMTARLWLISHGAQPDWSTIFNKGAFNQWRLQFDDSGFRIGWHVWINGVMRSTALVPITHNTLYRLECSFDGTHLRLFLNKDLKSTTGPFPGIINPVAVDLEIGRHYHLAAGRNFHGIIDHLEILNRVISPAARLLDYERRYPQ